MSPTRRDLLRFGAAALIGRALPQGHRPTALAAENTGVDVLDNGEAEQEIIDQRILRRETWHLFMFQDDYLDTPCAMFFVERYRDGTAQLIFEPPRPSTWRGEDDWEPPADSFIPNDRRVVHELRIDAETLESIDRGIRLYRKGHQAA